MSWGLNNSPLESERFLIKAGKIAIDNPSDVPTMIKEAKSQDFDFLSVRVDFNRIDLVQTLEKAGFFLTDTLVYYKRKLTAPLQPLERPTNYTIRKAETPDTDKIVMIAKSSFQDYIGHYHTDPKFDKSKVDAIYPDWTYRSCTEGLLSDVIFVTEENGEITSFATVRKYDRTAEGVLFGVHPNHQGKGIYRQLIRASMEWGTANNCSEVVYSTQLNNVAVQKVWIREGCEMNNAYYTLHLWLK